MRSGTTAPSYELPGLETAQVESAHLHHACASALWNYHLRQEAEPIDRAKETLPESLP
jgi:hypothetical protein